MPKARRGELWMADLGFVAKVRPVLILSVDYRNDERESGRFRGVTRQLSLIVVDGNRDTNGERR
jgi:hypothetical protein